MDDENFQTIIYVIGAKDNCTRNVLEYLAWEIYYYNNDHLGHFRLRTSIRNSNRREMYAEKTYCGTGQPTQNIWIIFDNIWKIFGFLEIMAEKISAKFTRDAEYEYMNEIDNTPST